MAKIKKEVATRRFDWVTVYPCIELDKPSDLIPSRLAKAIEKTLNGIGIAAATAPLLFDIRTLSLPDVRDWLNIVAQQIHQSDDDELMIWTSMIVSAEGQYCFGEDMLFSDAQEFMAALWRTGREGVVEAPCTAYAGDWYRLQRKGGKLLIECIHHGHVQDAFLFNCAEFQAAFQIALNQVYDFRDAVDSIMNSDESLSRALTKTVNSSLPKRMT